MFLLLLPSFFSSPFSIFEIESPDFRTCFLRSPFYIPLLFYSVCPSLKVLSLLSTAKLAIHSPAILAIFFVPFIDLALYFEYKISLRFVIEFLVFDIAFKGLKNVFFSVFKRSYLEKYLFENPRP